MALKHIVVLLAVAAAALVPATASAGNDIARRPMTVTTAATKPNVAHSVSGSTVSAGEKRGALQSKVKQEQTNLKKLKAEADKINDRSGANKFVNGLFGSDGGAADVSNRIKNESAAMKNAAAEIKARQPDIGQNLKELQAVQTKQGKRQDTTKPCKFAPGC